MLWSSGRALADPAYLMMSQEDGLVSEFFWGLLEPSGEECVAADSALKWKWNNLGFDKIQTYVQ